MLKGLTRGLQRIPVTNIVWQFEAPGTRNAGPSIRHIASASLMAVAITRGGPNGGGERKLWIMVRGDLPSSADAHILYETLRDQIRGLQRMEGGIRLVRGDEIHLGFYWEKPGAEELHETAIRLFRFVMEVLGVPGETWLSVLPAVTETAFVISDGKSTPLGEYLARKCYPPVVIR